MKKRVSLVPTAKMVLVGTQKHLKESSSTLRKRKKYCTSNHDCKTDQYYTNKILIFSVHTLPFTARSRAHTICFLVSVAIALGRADCQNSRLTFVGTHFASHYFNLPLLQREKTVTLLIMHLFAHTHRLQFIIFYE
jgi:hypothetical protein